MPIAPSGIAADASLRNVSGGLDYEGTAGEYVPGNRVVLVCENLLFVADKTQELIYPIIGISRYGAVEGERVMVRRTGPVAGFVGLKIGEAYFLGRDGMPTTDVPGPGEIYLRLGVAESESILFISFSPLILRTGDS